MRIRPCSIIMTGIGPSRVAVMAALREVRSDLSLVDAKAFIENLPQAVLEDVDLEEAERAARILASAGAEGRTEKPNLSTKIEDWLKERYTIEEIKALDEADDGQMDAENPARLGVWQELEQHAQPGDEFWSYSSPDVFWENLCGRGGYAVVRNGKVTYTVLTEMN